MAHVFASPAPAKNVSSPWKATDDDEQRIRSASASNGRRTVSKDQPQRHVALRTADFPVRRNNPIGQRFLSLLSPIKDSSIPADWKVRAPNASGLSKRYQDLDSVPACEN